MRQKQVFTTTVPTASIFSNTHTATNSSLTKYNSTFVKGLPQKKENASICVFISVGKEHCAGEQLRAVLKLLNKTFMQSEVLFILADKLQRFTNQLYGMDAETAEKKAIEDGLAWKTQHESMIANELTHLSYRFIHWSELTTQEDYVAYEQQIQEAYTTNPNFKRKFNKTANEFLSAQLGDPNVCDIANPEEGNKLCLAYLKEEASVQLELANQTENKLDYAVYPRNLSDALSVTYQTFITENMLVYLTVKNKLIKPEPALRENLNKNASELLGSTFTFFADENTKTKKISAPPSQESSPSSSPPRENCFSLLYIKSLKAIADSNMSSNDKIDLLKKMLSEAERCYHCNKKTNFLQRSR